MYDKLAFSNDISYYLFQKYGKNIFFKEYKKKIHKK